MNLQDLRDHGVNRGLVTHVDLHCQGLTTRDLNFLHDRSRLVEIQISDNRKGTCRRVLPGQFSANALARTGDDHNQFLDAEITGLQRNAGVGGGRG